jgi:hypothetical protein
MKRTTFSVFPLFAAGVCLMVLVLGTDAKIHHPKFKDAEGATLPNRYIIRFADKEATSAGNTLVQSFKKQFKGATIAVKHDYKHSLFNGISVTIDAEDAKVQESAIKTILDQTNVNAVYPVKMYKRPLVKAKKSDPPSILPHAMTQVDQVHSKLKNKGKGILVGILDTGKVK